MKAWNDNHDNPEQHNTDSYFDTSKEFENMFFRFESCNDDEYFEAKKDEFNKWKKFNVYCEVDHKGQKHTAGRWVFSQNLEYSTFHPKASILFRIFKENQKFNQIQSIVFSFVTSNNCK